ncbi:endolytic transglycosylase MltG [Tsukamurella sp. 8F]|uniref:endolytic transglycosylase MltG n=1 Tax=unclassified Tsukamurella TaxID=2633480 RepID=UPI0023B92DC0|nr:MULTISPECIES: endolytic transglycosylase MltG [unclassified Tsukamurella]MDF0529176.1 endolytic transglycosylase MltG [Tsukamurella sp. 8J]MDF0585361.1 endolytic transglycosylase MltG [Tsukamurella sp. 8F]
MNDGWHTQRAEPTQIGSEEGRPPTSRAERRRERERQARVARRRRFVFVAIVVIFLVVVAAVAYPLRHTLGISRLWGGDSVSAQDWSSGSEGADVVVHVTGSTNGEFAQNLVDAGVVRSVGAFNEAATDKPISAGYYLMRKHMSAQNAVTVLVDPQRAHRVGMLNVPPGAQLDDKRGIDKKTTRGIFSMIAEATQYEANGKKHAITVSQLAKAASTATPQALGVPDWAAAAVKAKTGDHRRLEGLIAPGIWDQVDPDASPTAILADLISKSAAKYEVQGLLDVAPDGPAKLTPYQALVSASVVEREVNKSEYYPKVARVVLNRLAKKQRLQMDSTVNYTASVTNIDVAGENLSKATDWNTYVKYGLPATPIGAVGQDALDAVEDPAPGPWLYFVTIDKDGTTLFTADYTEHEKNRQKACDSKLLSTGC